MQTRRKEYFGYRMWYDAMHTIMFIVQYKFIAKKFKLLNFRKYLIRENFHIEIII